jgi:hypothetical protein
MSIMARYDNDPTTNPDNVVRIKAKDLASDSGISLSVVYDSINHLQKARYLFKVRGTKFAYGIYTDTDIVGYNTYIFPVEGE